MGIVTFIVFGTLAGAALVAGFVKYGLDNAGPRSRTANTEKDIVMGKKMGKSRDRAMRKIYKRQKNAAKLGIMPLMEKVNSFNYKVNEENSGFAPLWEASNLLGSNKGQRKLSVCKSTIKIKELKNKKVGKWQKEKDKIVEEFGEGPMKTMGWMESIQEAGGGKYLNLVKGYGEKREDGTYSEGADYEIRYQMAATSYKEAKGYDPNELFGGALKQFRNNLPTTRATFKRFGVNYPISSQLIPDRFVVGNNKTIFNLSKLMILANACSKFSETPGLTEVQVIDESQSKNSDKVKYLTRSQFAQYVSAYVNSESGKKGLEDLTKIDKSQTKAIQDTLENYVESYKTEIEK